MSFENSLVKIPAPIQQQCALAMENDIPKQVGFVEIITDDDGNVTQRLVFTQNDGTEIYLPLQSTSKPTIPCLSFQPSLLSTGSNNNNDNNNNNNNNINAAQHNYRFDYQIENFSQISIPLELHQEFIRQEQLANEQKREARQLKVMSQDAGFQNAQIDLSHYHIHQQTLRADAKNKQKKFALEDEVVLRKLMELFNTKKFCSFDEMSTFTNQPKSSLKKLVDLYCTKISKGPEHGKYTLKYNPQE